MEATPLDAIDPTGGLAGAAQPVGGPPGPADDSADPFGTAAIRGRVLDAWAASPARFREDANAEEDAALGAYRDRLVVELLQNAVDAAVAAGVPGRVRLVLAGRQLEVANTGAPLTADGVEALSTLRASAKRDTSAIGRFGAGFAAVLAVSDDPSIVSRPARGAAPVGVSWSKARTVAAVHEIGAAGLRAELARRGGAVPVLRLPFAEPAPLPPPAGYDTVVRLPLRDADAVATARQLLTDFDPTLLLVLPGLAEVVLDIDDEVRTHTCVWEHRGRLAGQAEKVREAGPAGFGPPAADPVETALDATLEVALLDGQHWRGCVRAGTIPAALLADRPVEERARTGYAARAMVPDDGWPKGVPRVVRAPQPTDEPLSLPVLVSVELPLEPSRRHTVAGPLRDWLTDRLAEAIAALAVHIGTAGTEAAADAAGLAAAPAEVTLAGLVAELDQPSGGAAGEQRPAVERDPLVPPDPLAALELVPTGLPAGPVDGRLRDALHRLLPRTGMMPGGRLGRECVVCDLGPATDAVTALLAAPHPATPDGHGAASRPDVVDVAFDLGTPAALGADPDAGFDDLAPTGLANRYRDGGPIVAGLLPAQYAARRWRPALDALGVRRLDSAGLVEALAGARRPPSWWAALYATLISAPDRDALGALPVPVAVVAGEDSWDDDAELADPTPPGPGGDAEVGPAGSGRSGAPGLRVRMVTGPRGVLLPTDELDVVALAASGLPLRVAHPQACAGAARDALRTLGAVEGTPAGVLRDPAVREAVADSDPDDDPQDLMALATAVLALVRDAGLTQREVALGLDWLGDLLLPDADGEFVAASELLIEGGPLDRVVSDDAPFATLDPRVAQAWPAEVLEAVGVLRSFGVLYATDVPLDPDEPVLLDLDDSDTWVEEAVDSPALAPARRAAARVGAPGAPLVLSGFAAVRDLELVDPAAWPEALAELARPPLRDVVLGEEPSYTRWWLSRHALLPVATSPEQDDEDGEDGDGEGGGGWARAVRRDAGEVVRLPPPELRLPGADPLLAGLFAPAAPLPMVDDDFLRALGCRYTLDDVLGDLPGVLDLLDRLGDAERDIPWPSARALYVAAVTAATRLAAGPDGDPHGTLADGRLDPPLTVRTPLGVVPTEDAVVLDAPDLLTLLGDVAPLRVPLDRAAEVGYVLGVPLASAVSDCPVVADAEGDETTVRHAPDATPYVEHTRLTVVDLSGRPVRTPWRVVGGIGGEIHVDAAAGTDALARALAWRAGTWYRRHALAAALRDPQGRAFRDAEDDLDDL